MLQHPLQLHHGREDPSRQQCGHIYTGVVTHFKVSFLASELVLEGHRGVVCSAPCTQQAMYQPHVDRVCRTCCPCTHRQRGGARDVTSPSRLCHTIAVCANAVCCAWTTTAHG